MRRLIPGALPRPLGIVLVAAGWLARGQELSEPGEEIDRIVAVVEGAEDGRVITRSDLELEHAVAMVQQGAAPAATAHLDDQGLRAALDYSISQRLLIAEADKVGAFQPSDAELDALASAFEERFESPAAFQRFLQRYDADRAALREVLRRVLRAERVLDGRVRLRAQVSEVEVRRYYDLHQQELVGTFEEVRSSLRQRLLRDRYAKLAAEELAQLRKAADVRLVAPPPPATDETEPEGEGGGR